MADAIVTVTARSKMMKARAGAISLPPIVGMAFGSGGVDSSGEVIPLDTDQTTLVSELYRKEIDKYTFLSDTSCRYTCTLEASELGGEYISEIGLYDEEGDLVAIKNFTKKGKDSDLEMTFNIDDTF